jgi:gluconolactonase
MDAKFQVNAPAFRRIVDEEAKVEHLAAGFGFTEGPIWRGDHLLLSDIPNSRIIKYQCAEEGPVVTTFRYPAGNPNGLTLDGGGRLLACEHSNRRVSRTEADGTITVLADRYQGGRLNSPNDVVLRSDGSTYFTDPPYGLARQPEGKELDFQGVFRISPDGQTLTLLVADMERPNGLAFSPDEKILYIADSARRHIMAFRVEPDGTLTGGGVFADLVSEEQGVPDGMKVDVEGNIYSTGPGGVWVFDDGGTVLGRIPVPQLPANCAWGDDDWRGLYVTARTGLYRVRLNIPGIKVG